MRRPALALGFWGAWYAAYRFYYGFGGDFGMIGVPSPALHFRRDNLIGGVIILLAALLPSIAVAAWHHRPCGGSSRCSPGSPRSGAACTP